MESPMLTCWPSPAGVKIRVKTLPVSGEFGLIGTTGAVPVGPPWIPLPKRGVAGPPSQLITMTMPALAAMNRARGNRMYFGLLRSAPRFQHRVTIVHDVRRDQDEQIPLRLIAAGHAEQTADEREVYEKRNTGLAYRDAGLSETAHDSSLTVGHEHHVIDRLRRKDRADRSADQLDVGVL